MQTYLISESVETGLRACTEKEIWLECPILQKDDSGNSMTVVLEFEAETWNEAMQRYRDHYGYGKYAPMEDFGPKSGGNA